MKKLRTFNNQLVLGLMLILNLDIYAGNQVTPKINYNAMFSVGGWHTCALLQDKSIQCWGDNSYGQIGNGNTNYSLVPTKSLFQFAPAADTKTK